MRAFDNTSYGNTESYIANSIMAEKTLDPAGSELQASWVAQGQIYSVPVVKTSQDTSKSVELQVTFASAPAAVSFLTAVYENFVSIPYSRGIPAGATASLV
jgi:hypothetical protein